MRHSMTTALSALVLFTASAASAATLHFSAALNGASEVPPNATKGSGQVTASLDTVSKALTYTATYSGTTGPGVAAHFHGPAAPGANGPVAVPVTNPASPISGSATLTDAQIADLEGGKWYFNVHTAANPGGEIRGQVQAAK